ncbi:peptidase M14 carboxypeptidase A [Natrialba chahannaoensis JCM 10990]|uniref:Peptidase M14 carboxypeptidase A n=1 Tax=Natrialba chahannaoensis JCM 10990 TaxID=1227492 RepID=M0AW77_9EURY|nr:M14 family metallopeptidase [Natrialba chahannaoensis]ELZ02223.1 peptidase M14 carboxypeptidase A [Natrialba chahannaoensis JCM 10990]
MSRNVDNKTDPRSTAADPTVKDDTSPQSTDGDSQPPLSSDTATADTLAGSIDNDSSIDRRTFLSLSAATGAALTLPGSATADVSDDILTDELEYVLNHTPEEYEAATSIVFTDQDTFDAFADEYEEDPDPDLSRAPKAVTRELPTLSAHAHLTAAEVEDVLAMGDGDDGDGIGAMNFAPGANPWWTLEEPYADGVFPPIEEAREYIAYEETVQALEYIENTHSDRVHVESIGESPGWTNLYTGEDPDPRDIYVAEVTNDVHDDASFAAKEKVVYSLNIHGDERAGTEAGCRLIEEIARGEAADFEHLLDDIVLLFLFTNPDGWVSRKPQTEVPWVADHNTNFQRGNASTFEGQPVDTNRQYPTMGWTNPSFRPAEPEGAPEEFHDLVPDSLAIVEHFREYDNVAFLCDYHGMYTADHMVFNLETNAPFDHDGTHDLDEVNIQIGEGMQEFWGDIDAIADDISTAGEEMYGFPFVPDGDSCDGLFDWGTIYDSLSYQITGGFLGWAGQPEEFGGLGAITVAPEIILSNHYTAAQKKWKPYWTRHYEEAYRISMREYAAMTARETHATVETGGQDTAYVTTDELTRSSADLPHTDDQPGRGGPGRGGPGRGRGQGQERATSVQRRHEVVQPGPGTQSQLSAETTADSHSLFVDLEGVGNATEGAVRVRNPDGTVVHEIDIDAKADPRNSAARTHDFEEVFVRRPEAGQWTIEAESDAELNVLTTVVDVADDEEIPDPVEVLGYEQREYSVNPMQFFADLDDDVVDGDIEGMSVHHVSVGRLLRGNSGMRHYDKVVVSHDDGIDDPDYVGALEDFVEAGGDLVLTDSGVNLLAVLETGGATDIAGDDIANILVPFANLEDRDFDHPLLAGIRTRQQEIWKGSQLGYTTGVDQPATIVDVDAFETAGGAVAGTFTTAALQDGESTQLESGVAAGLLPADGGDGEIAVVGSVLPPAQQTELHPFGMADYAVSFMGHTLLCNALGFEQRRYADGELVRTYGEIR